MIAQDDRVFHSISGTECQEVWHRCNLYTSTRPTQHCIRYDLCLSECYKFKRGKSTVRDCLRDTGTSMVCDCVSDTGSRGVQASTWEWMKRMSQTRQSMPAVQTKHRWVGGCVHVCVCLHVSVRDSVHAVQTKHSWVDVCVCVCAYVCGCVCVPDSVCLWQSRQNTGWCLSVPTSVLVRDFPQDAGACVCLSVHVHVCVMLQGSCILRHVSSTTVHFATTIGADISV